MAMSGSRLQFSLAMMMSMLIHNYIMIVLVGMYDGMRMRASIMGVCKGMNMQMSVMPCNRIHDNKHSSDYHDNQCNKVDPSKFFPCQNK